MMNKIMLEQQVMRNRNVLILSKPEKPFMPHEWETKTEVCTNCLRECECQ